MNGIIVLDGPDACGKTTLAKEIEKRCGMLGIPYQYQHAHYRWKNRMFTYHEAIVRKAIKFSQQGIAVIDRLYWSEFVYGEVFRGGSRWPMQWRFFDRLLQRYCAINVICCGKSAGEVVGWHQEAKRERSEMYEDGLDKVTSLFIDIYNKNHTREDYHLYYRPHFPDSYTRLRFVDKILQRVTQRRDLQMVQALDANAFNFLGYLPTAKYLFVGEQLNNKTHHQTWPFFEYGYSSLFLTEALDALDFREEEAVWTNYFCEINQFYLHDILAYNSNIQVISLGGNQAEVMKRLHGIDSTIVYHPSYARRFNYTDYGNQLKKALGYA